MGIAEPRVRIRPRQFDEHAKGTIGACLAIFLRLRASERTGNPTS